MLKNKRKRKLSSRRWLERQHSDPYVAEAKRLGYRSRSAFKLIQIDDRFRLLKPGHRVLDLGAAPGGWTQVAVKRVRATSSSDNRVVAVDTSEMSAPLGAIVLRLDLLDPAAPELIIETLGGPVDVVLSDMAPPSTGHPGTDHLRIMALAEAAVDLAIGVLAPGGAFVCKVWQGGAEASLLATLKQRFAVVRHAKPAASRSDSAEMFVVATGFRGGVDAEDAEQPAQ